MKFEMYKRIRIAVISFLLLVLCVAVYVLINQLITSYKNENIPIISYSSKPEIHYSVSTKPNILYEETNLEEDQIYIFEYMNSVNVSFNYEFTRDKEGEIKADYSAYILFEANVKSIDDADRDIWQKRYDLIPNKTVSVNDTNLTINENVSIKVDQYRQFVDEVMTSSRVQSSVRMSVVMPINIKTKADNITLDEHYSPSISFPFNTSYFSITKAGNEPTEGEKTKTVEKEVEKNVTLIIFMSIAVLLLAAGLVYLLFFTTNKEIDEHDKKVQEIFKKHGSRIVAVRKCEIPESHKEISLKSMEDLVHVSDELEKPIMYNYSMNSDDINVFYVIDNNILYKYDMLSYENNFHYSHV